MEPNPLSNARQFLPPPPPSQIPASADTAGTSAFEDRPSAPTGAPETQSINQDLSNTARERDDKRAAARQLDQEIATLTQRIVELRQARASSQRTAHTQQPGTSQ